MIPIYTGWANHSGEKERKGKKHSIRDLNWLLNSDCCWWYCWYWIVSYQSFANQTTFGRFHHFTYYSMPIDQNDIIFLYLFFFSKVFSFLFVSLLHVWLVENWCWIEEFWDNQLNLYPGEYTNDIECADTPHLRIYQFAFSKCMK